MTPDGERLDYDALLALLERVYAASQKRCGPGPAWRKLWTGARDAGCEQSGWTTDEFYAEMDRRRAEKST